MFDLSVLPLSGESSFSQYIAAYQKVLESGTLDAKARRVLARGLLFMLMTLGWPAPASAAEPPQALQPQLEVTHRARSLQPGEAVVIEVEASYPGRPVAEDGEQAATAARLRLRDVRATAFGSQVRGYPREEGRWEVLLGIDLDVEPGTYPVEVSALVEDGGPESGRTLRTQHVLWIEEKEFPTRKLTVEPKYVDPPPETRERIARESRLLVDLFHTSTPRRYWQGEFSAPVPGRVNRDSFGKRSVFNGKPRSPHTGADFSAPAGTPIKAPNAGKVVLARDLYFAGQTVILDHGLGLYSFFAHLSEFKVEEGQMVERGHVLGLTGSTGRVTGPHLHYAVRLDNARVDPLALIELLR